jgi:hypothetical protein
VSSPAGPWQRLPTVEILQHNALKSLFIDYSTELTRYGPRRNTPFPAVPLLLRGNVFTEPLPRNGSGIFIYLSRGRRIVRAVHATIFFICHACSTHRPLNPSRFDKPDIWIWSIFFQLDITTTLVGTNTPQDFVHIHLLVSETKYHAYKTKGKIRTQILYNQTISFNKSFAHFRYWITAQISWIFFVLQYNRKQIERAGWLKSKRFWPLLGRRQVQTSAGTRRILRFPWFYQSLRQTPGQYHKHVTEPLPCTSYPIHYSL